MKVLVVAQANSSHTVKICNQLIELGGVDVTLFSIQKPLSGYDARVKIEYYQSQSKLGYFFAIHRLRQLRSRGFSVVHVHYASGYGVMAWLANIPYVLSVWGSDVLKFPYKSRVHRFLINRVLRKATKIFATSRVLQDEVLKLGGRSSEVVPFGVNQALFKPRDVSNTNDAGPLKLVICKSLKPIYGIDLAISAIALLAEQGVETELNIIGAGPAEEALKQQASKLSVRHLVTFHGSFTNSEVADVISNYDVYLAPSLSESFGVSLLEASSAELAIVCSDIPCFHEVCLENQTALFFPVGDYATLAHQIKHLHCNRDVLNALGSAGRKYVSGQFSEHLPSAKYLQFYNGNGC